MVKISELEVRHNRSMPRRRKTKMELWLCRPSINRSPLTGLTLSLTLALFAGLSTRAAQFKFPNQTLTVPDGFEVELIAQSPLVDRPISGSFDEQGRLYLT